MLYLFSLFRDRQLPHEQNPSVLLIGDPAFNPRLAVARDLQRLPHAAVEVDRLRALYPGAIPLTDKDATVPALFARAEDSTIVHIAAHTIVNASIPSRSILLLAPSAHHTGALEAQELLTQLKLDRKTRLVVLSTCSSAGGLPLGPEGVAPLVRPLIAAGVPAVIGSLWDVPDATAEEVMVSFHSHYRTSSDVATALQAAQVELLGNKNPGLRSVLAWASFQVIGYASSPSEVTRQ
jgi:CHAT domain-containing protein